MTTDAKPTPGDTPDPALIAVGRGFKRPATQREIESARPYAKAGSKGLARVGILFLHGFTATPGTFRHYAENFAAEGFTVSIPALPGHGVTPDELIAVDYNDWLEACLEAYDQIQAKCDRVYLVGISLGGALALHLSTQRDVSGKLFLISPAVYPVLLFKLCGSLIFPVFERFGIHFWTSVAGDIKKKDGYEIAYSRTAINGLRQLILGMKQVQALLPDVVSDVLIFQGRIDHEIPPHKTPMILEELGSARKELIWLENSYHEVTRDNDADFVLEAIRTNIHEEIKELRECL